MMKKSKLMRSAVFALVVALGSVFSFGSTSILASGDPTHPKNWTPPDYKIYAQQLSDEIMASHPELISVTFHAVPPGMTDAYTMFAGSFPERIGNVDDFDDVMVIKSGITILDPRWHRTTDPIPKYLVMAPFRDVNGENLGLLVLAYHNPPGLGRSEREFFEMGTALRDQLSFRIPSKEALFEKAK